MKLFYIKVVVFRPIVNNMFSNTAQTQNEVLHSISHSAFNVLNILMGMMTMQRKNHLHILETSPARMHTASAKPGSTSPPTPTTHPLCEPPTDSLLLPGTCSTIFHACRHQHLSVASVIASKSFKSLFHYISTTSN